MVHEIKIRKEFAEAVLIGDKNFEVRENDRGYQKGDVVIFQVVDKHGLAAPSQLNGKFYEITYVLTGWGIEPGYCVFGIKEIQG